MGLPDKIKRTLSNKSNTPATPDNTPAPKEKNPPGRSKRPITDGLPAFKQPPLPPERRAILVACASTRRASWAVLKSEGEGPHTRWAFERNIPAVPDTSAPGAAAKRAGPTESTAGATDSTEPETRIADIDFGGYSCGVCGADGSFGNIFIRCGHCKTLHCQPASHWQCPHCGLELGDKPMHDMSSLSTSTGSSLHTGPTRPGLASAGSGPDAENAIENSRAIPGAGRKGKRG